MHSLPRSIHVTEAGQGKIWLLQQTGQHQNKSPQKCLLHKQNYFSLRDTTTLANSFATCFKDKIEKIRTVFQNGQVSYGDVKPHYTPPTFLSFSYPNPQPSPVTFIFKECLDVLLTPITSIINLSLAEGVSSDKFKQAFVTPLLKKLSLDKDTFQTYGPVSSFNFLSKVTEKEVAFQIKAHIQTSKLDNKFQSAYKAFHSTETALLSG